MDQRKARTIRNRAVEFLNKVHIVLTPKEVRNIEVADFGLNDIDTIGVEVVVYENNDRYCAKELVLLPGQTCPEHRHPPRGEHIAGKMETFRCRWGVVYLYVEGVPTRRMKAVIPEAYERYFTVRHEIILQPGDQYTLPPDSLHWFQAGTRGAILSEFSSASDDASDVFTDPHIQRIPADEV